MIRYGWTSKFAHTQRNIFFRSTRGFRSSTSHPNDKSVSLSFNKLPKSINQTEDKATEEAKKIENQRTDSPEYTPTLTKVREMMDKYKEYVVLTQLGSFYELYFEHAVEFSSKLNLNLGKRQVRGKKIPMAGFPLSQIDRHLKVLVQDLNLGVAIVEQFKNETSIENEVNKVTRRLTRIITPGTLVDEAFLNQKENNFLLSIDISLSAFKREALEDMKIGLAWADISVGLTYIQETTLRELLPTINQIGPSEIIFNENLLPFKLETGDWYPEMVELKRYFRKYQTLPTAHKTMEMFFSMFEIVEDSDKEKLKSFNQKETAALKNLLHYIDYHLPESPIRLQIPIRRIPKHIMQIDSRTSDALELHKSFKDDLKKGSLVHTIRRTVTDSGSRLLSKWVMAPSTDTREINRRQALVTLFYKHTLFRIDVISKLNEVHDISRIVQRFVMGRGSAIELIHLAHTIQTLQELQNTIEIEAKKTLSKQKLLAKFLVPFPKLVKLSELILHNIREDELLAKERMEEEAREDELSPETIQLQNSKKIMNDEQITKLSWTVKPNASPTLQKAHDYHNELLEEEKKMLEQLNVMFKETLGFKSVELRNSISLGYQLYIRSVKGSSTDKLESMPEFHIKSKNPSALWVNYRPWTVLGEAIENSTNRIFYEEQQLIKSLKKKVVHQSSALRSMGELLDLLDVTSSFAVLAHERNLVCPKVDKSLDLDIIKGRHLVVEDGLKRTLKNFTPNDHISRRDKPLWVITGPNMGGKSTFLRQNAVIVILAQIGSYVPAESATIGVVDKIFSRVGAADDLYNDLSTFMVEMIETSYILKGATERSLAILDEVGRGTSGSEGLAIAFATLHHLLTVNKSRALFATHFGDELHKFLGDRDLGNFVEFKKTQVKENENGKRLIFNHQMEDGISEKSYAIEVAGMAGFPTSALQIASETLKKL
ncbi:hypothetical protein BN7_487 [Wickerhamomyces ciferrii]|uniref:DNA mismatch repair proteins mutS family domain-containing protein n=1 Tax=Wickerhamomyces ciferrii (strain ATCC 14091 / BCRC 22168 / CBS 111 / JCM 3599 / NBRC 0793 / NRRL Y-1031 F-60-10) TaxID=1206466 RepID=K0KIG6_WICCF|nr:uncharacterized protein BN7_487 [Wickerhamomyces ciferrii]CCH40953.1 hypothetical protein BN7_487 [Wickerhamomyces ciferrii]